MLAIWRRWIAETMMMDIVYSKPKGAKGAKGAKGTKGAKGAKGIPNMLLFFYNNIKIIEHRI